MLCVPFPCNIVYTASSLRIYLYLVFCAVGGVPNYGKALYMELKVAPQHMPESCTKMSLRFGTRTVDLRCRQ